MNGFEINGSLTVKGPVYAIGPVFVQGVDVRAVLDEINAKISKIQQEDLVILKQNLDRLLAEFPIENKVRGYLETLKRWIEIGKDIQEIVEFLKQSWLEIGPIVTNILLNNKTGA